MKLLWIIVIVSGSACGTIPVDPYVGYTHTSSPSLSNDGADLICAGVKFERTVEISTSWCENMNTDWAGINIDVEYVWRGRK